MEWRFGCERAFATPPVRRRRAPAAVRATDPAHLIAFLTFNVVDDNLFGRAVVFQ